MNFKYWVWNLAYIKTLTRNYIGKSIIVEGHMTGTFYISKHFNRGIYDIKGDYLPQIDLRRI